MGLTEHDVATDDASPGHGPERVRVRVRKKRRRRFRQRWLWLPMLGGLFLLFLIAGGLLARDALVVRRSLVTAQAELVALQSAAGELDLAQASVSLTRAETELADARTRSAGPLWRVAAQVPILGDSVEVVRAVVATASAGVDVARSAVNDGGQLLTDGLDVQVVDNQVDLAPLYEARDVLAGLPLERLVASSDRLRAVDPAWAPQELLDGRRDTLRFAEDTITTVERGRELMEALPGFLGADGPRNYFLGVQTPAELRGTGGLIGYFALLSVDDGRFELGASEAYDGLEEDEVDPGSTTQRIGTLGGDPADGATVDADFADRYQHVAAAGNFSNVNVDPDLPVTADVALELFEVRTGQTLDGMVLLDQVALGDILTATGTRLEIPQEYRIDTDLPPTIPPEELTRLLTIDLYQELGDGRSSERKALLEHLGDAAFEAVFAGGWDGVPVARALGASDGQPQPAAVQPDARRAGRVQHRRDRGALRGPDDADLFAVTANNAVGGKQDVHVGHHVTVDLALADPRQGDDGVTRRAVARPSARSWRTRCPPEGWTSTSSATAWSTSSATSASRARRARTGPGSPSGPREARRWSTPAQTTVRSRCGRASCGASRSTTGSWRPRRGAGSGSSSTCRARHPR
jgi:hypothetical protein